MARIAIMALEGIEVDIEVPASGTDMPLDNLSDDYMSISVTSDEIDDTNDSIDEATDVFNSLESMALVLKDHK